MRGTCGVQKVRPWNQRREGGATPPPTMAFLLPRDSLTGPPQPVFFCSPCAIMTRGQTVFGLLATALFLARPDFGRCGGVIAGFHIDDESCSGLLANNRTEQEIACQLFFNKLVNVSAQVRNGSQGLPQGHLTLSVDTGTGWVCEQGQTNCFNLTFNGETKSVAEHVVDLADMTVLMDYDRTTGSILRRAEPFLRYADMLDKERSVVIGLAIVEKGSAPAWWQTGNAAELETLMQSSLAALAQYKSFRGFAVFTDDAWASQSNGPRSSTGVFKRWLRGVAGGAITLGTWYTNHTMILRDRQAARRWLAWAAAQGITEVYTAPHASSLPLISIPGKEGSLADDAIFCSFLHEAASMNVTFQLLSDPMTDLPFIHNCSKHPNRAALAAGR